MQRVERVSGEREEPAGQVSSTRMVGHGLILIFVGIIPDRGLAAELHPPRAGARDWVDEVTWWLDDMQMWGWESRNEASAILNLCMMVVDRTNF